MHSSCGFVPVFCFIGGFWACKAVSQSGFFVKYPDTSSPLEALIVAYQEPGEDCPI